MARNDVDLSTFSQQMNENIDAVVEDNPELYEKANKGRFPASVNVVEKVPVEKIDEGTGLEHGSGQKEW